MFSCRTKMIISEEGSTAPFRYDICQWVTQKLVEGRANALRHTGPLSRSCLRLQPSGDY